MWFVDVLVEDGEMKPSVHPIDAVVSEEQVTKKKVSWWYVKVRKAYAQGNGSKEIEIAICIESVVHF